MEINSDIPEAIINEEADLFLERTPNSRDFAQQATATMPGGVPSGVITLDPYPMVIDYGKGAYLYDIDGNEYIDYANGFGTSVFGHANPVIVQAVKEQVEKGAHFGALTEPAYKLSEELCLRYNLDWVRFVNSGTEATMDAIRLARARTGREKIIKIEGAYHGSNPEALVSPNLGLEEEFGDPGPDLAPNSRPFGKGVAKRTLEDVVILPFNNLEVIAQRLVKEDIAAVITEPILFNVGTIFPEDGYLSGLKALCQEHGTLLIFDETKTSASVAYGGAEELFSVRPDIKTLGKGVGGGLSIGVVGETTDDSYDGVRDFDIPILGTFSGNPLVSAAGYAALNKVLTRSSYKTLTKHHLLLRKEIDKVIEEFELPAYTIGAGAKTCIVWVDPSGGQLKDFRDYQRRFDFDTGFAAWIFLINRGILLAPGQDEQLTHSVDHTDKEAYRLVEAFSEFAKRLRK
jgi:glutamate-1-semialdehyde 2,1-aminomutase